MPHLVKFCVIVVVVGTSSIAVTVMDCVTVLRIFSYRQAEYIT
jgi:hypothetical protein